jgi:hypothetical protein
MNNGGIGSIGRVPNPEHGQKISVALTGKFRPDVGARNKVNNSKMWEQRRAEGWAFDDDTIEKIRESATGRKHSQVSKDKIAAANKTRVVSDETKLKISAARKASVGTRTHSDETKQKMKEAWEKRRAAKTAPPSPT